MALNGRLGASVGRLFGFFVRIRGFSARLFGFFVRIRGFSVRLFGFFVRTRGFSASSPCAPSSFDR
jgi:hypothetical protein